MKNLITRNLQSPSKRILVFLTLSLFTNILTKSQLYGQDIYTRGHAYFYAYEGNGRSGTAYLQARDRSNRSSIGLQLRSQVGGSIRNALKIAPNGFVGVNTTNPKERLDIVGHTRINNNRIYFRSGTDKNHGIGFNAMSNVASIDGPVLYGWEGGALGSTQGGEKITLAWKENGNVGIGTTSPNQKLDVKGYGRFQNSTSNFLDIGHGGSNSFINHNGTGDLNFRYKNRPMMTLTQGGSLGIGTVSPTEKLDVLGNIKVDGGTIKLNTGDVALDTGNVIIGQSQLSSITENENTLLTVTGGVKTDKVILNIGTFPDYVFDASYPLMPIEEVADYISENKHLPNIPSEKEIIASGLDVKMMNIKLVEKIEELTLYTIQQQETISAQQKALLAQQESTQTQEKLMQELLKRIEKLEQN